uniref:Sushi domain-containing protein n=1 Tax=Peromyscus maniculatus bairdii TaxID=230844 RepID=A0A8C8UD34_PERMB
FSHCLLINFFLCLFLLQVKPCDFPQIKNGRLYDEERYRPYFPVPIGKRFHYLCNSGFVTASRGYWDFIHCTARGWEPAVPCHRQCVIHKVENGESLSWQRSLIQDQSVKVKCYPGYCLPNGQDTVTCTENGWSPQPKCIHHITGIPHNPTGLPCGPPPSNNHDIVSHELDSYQHGEEVAYSCAEGFGIDGPALIKCEGGKWIQPPTCINSTGNCGPPPPIDNGDITSFPLPVYAPLSSVEYQCQSLYQLQGNKKITCRNGEWSEPPKCLHACVIREEIMERHNITLRWKERQKLYSPSGDEVEFQCKYGYKKIKTSPSLRTKCVDGHISYPSCSKSHYWFSG